MHTTRKELRRIGEIIRQIAIDNHVTEEQVRYDMKAAMDVGRQNPDPVIRSRWDSFAFSGDEPTVDEFIFWIASQVGSKRSL